MREAVGEKGAVSTRRERSEAEELEGGDDLPCSYPQTLKLPRTNTTTLSAHHEEEHEIVGTSPMRSYHGVNSSDNIALKRSDKQVYLSTSLAHLVCCYVAHTNTNKRRHLSRAFSFQKLVKR